MRRVSLLVIGVLVAACGGNDTGDDGANTDTDDGDEIIGEPGRPSCGAIDTEGSEVVAEWRFTRDEFGRPTLAVQVETDGTERERTETSYEGGLIANELTTTPAGTHRWTHTNGDGRTQQIVYEDHAHLQDASSVTTNTWRDGDLQKTVIDYATESADLKDTETVYADEGDHYVAMECFPNNPGDPCNRITYTGGRYIGDIDYATEITRDASGDGGVALTIDITYDAHRARLTEEFNHDHAAYLRRVYDRESDGTLLVETTTFLDSPIEPQARTYLFECD